MALKRKKQKETETIQSKEQKKWKQKKSENFRFQKKKKWKIDKFLININQFQVQKQKWVNKMNEMIEFLQEEKKVDLFLFLRW